MYSVYRVGTSIPFHPKISIPSKQFMNCLRRNKRKVVWLLRLLKKGKDSFCKKVFEKEWNKCKIPGRKRKQWKKCVLDIISDMDLTST